jgi:hypothetical protein
MTARCDLGHTKLRPGCMRCLMWAADAPDLESAAAYLLSLHSRGLVMIGAGREPVIARLGLSGEVVPAPTLGGLPEHRAERAELLELFAPGWETARSLRRYGVPTGLTPGIPWALFLRGPLAATLAGFG